MLFNLKSILFHNVVLKVASFVLACIFWYLISQAHASTLRLELPLCFYNSSQWQTIDAPEKITITLQGSRTDLRTLDLDALALHVNGALLQTGPNRLTVTNATLFLPDTIKLLNYSPSNVVISACAAPSNTEQHNQTI